METVVILSAKFFDLSSANFTQAMSFQSEPSASKSVDLNGTFSRDVFNQPHQKCNKPDKKITMPNQNDSALNDFEESLEQLEAIVERMEKGELSLEQSLEAFEQGVKLTRNCQQTLRKAEQRVNELLEENGELKKVPFNSEDDQSQAV